MEPRQYLELGWNIFPCHTIVRGRCTCGKESCSSPGKHPRTVNGVKDASHDTHVVDLWFASQPSNIAVACGAASGIIVIDIDQKHGGFSSLEAWEEERGEPLPETLISLTGGGGRHLFFKYPADGMAVPNRNGWLPGVDVRSDGGYVILPPGTHISGGSYAWKNLGARIAPAPLDLLQAIRSNTGGPTNTGLPDTASILEGIAEGQRDATLYRFACRLRRQLNDNREAVEILVLEAARRAKPPFPENEARAKVDQAFKQDHDDNTSWDYLTAEDGDPIHPPTDLGNALRFVDANLADMRYVPGLGWMSWSDIGWRLTSEHDIKYTARSVPAMIVEDAISLSKDGHAKKSAQMASWAKQTQSLGKQSAFLDMARDDIRIRHEASEFDSDDFVIACRNGIVDLRTGDVRDFTREDLISKNTNIVYDPDYRLTAWERFLEETTQGDTELIAYLQRAAGYTLTGSNAEECFFVVSGPPASGKSTYLDALLAVCGDYGKTTQSDTFMYRRGQQVPSNEIARLVGVRMLSVSEIREGELFNEQLIKQFTGGDMVSGRFLYREAFDYRPQLKLWIGTNHEPDARDDAMWRRIKKIPFGNAIPEERRDNKLKLLLSDPDVGGRAILAWAVRGAMEWVKHGLSQPSTVTSAVHAYRSEQDRTQQFIDECLIISPDSAVPFTDLFQTYALWSKLNSETLLRRPQFTKAMQARGLTKIKHEADGKEYITGASLKPVNVTTNGVSWQ